VTVAYPEREVRAASLRSRIAKAVAVTLREAEGDRETIAAAMSVFLGEEVSKNMLDAYASEAREDHTIPYLRLLALVHVTGDVRPMQLGAEQFGHAVIDERYLPWVEIGRLADERERLERAYETARRAARTGGRP
jgi:hypothetical protein